MKTTANLNLPLALSGHVPMKQSVERAFNILDEAMGPGFGTAVEFDPVATANASDLATAIALVNALKVRVNEMTGIAFVTRDVVPG